MNDKNANQYGKFQAERYEEDFQYYCFLPKLLPEEMKFDNPNIIVLLEKATQKLGELNAYAKLVPDIDFFIKMHELKEATESSRIEGTQTGIDEAAMEKEDLAPEKRDDWEEVQNYVRAMRFAIDRLNKVPLTMNLAKEIHAILLSGVRGKNRQPGEVRRVQNWIGGATIKDAKFVPPPVNELPALLGDLNHYWNDKALTVPILIKAAVSHYQFETIHPFLDGNGRLGRLMIVLFLMDKKKLDRPVLYLSRFFAEHREEYYDALDGVRRRGDMEHWLRFFLVAVAETASYAVETLQKIIELKEKNSQRVLGFKAKAKLANNMLTIMYERPTISIAQATEALGVSVPTTASLVKDLVGIGVLKELTGAQRNRVYEYSEYLDLFRTK